MIAALLLALAVQVPAKPRTEVQVLAARPDKPEVRVGEVLKVAFDLEVPYGWHIYPTLPTTTGTPTFFEFEKAEVAGNVEEPGPKTHPSDGIIAAYTYHEGKITLTVPLRLKPGATPGALEVKGFLDYQICKHVCISARTPLSFSVVVLEGLVAVVPPPPTPPPAQTGAAESARVQFDSRGFLGFLLFAAAGGALSLVMPCVYPLIPITLTYFIKQGAGSRAKSIALSSAYAAGIVVVFTGVGFLFSALLGADGPRVFAADPWVNGGVGLLFLWFAFSLFGLYEISLPSWLVGGVTGQRRSGVGGAFILGALFSVVTFTCTVPIAASVLALGAASGPGSKFASFFGMLTYSGTMALPFFLLGLFPGLLKEVPRSGGWLHTVKVTAGFAEFALAFYYFSKADFVLELGFLSRDVMTALWIASLVLMALYLLKVFRMKGDDETPSPVGVFRMLWALLFLIAAVQFGSLYGGRAAGGLALVLPPPAVGEETSASGGKRDAQTMYPSLDLALEEAKRAGKPIFVEFTGAT